MAKWGIFQCQNCGKRFREKFEQKTQFDIDPEHVARYKDSIMATHHCKENVFGCGVLIGAVIRKRKS